MDKKRAERLAGAIEHETWIKVIAIEQNKTTQDFEVKIQLRSDDLPPSRFIWVYSPRRWATLKWSHGRSMWPS